MAQSDGEKELILGNKQLISLFFVVVALCGVFFALGYRIGSNSSKTAPTAADSVSPPAPESVGREQPEPPREADAAPVAATPPTDTLTPAPAPAPAETTPAPAAAAPPPQAKPYETSAPETGASYVQVAALPRADADNVVRTLREQHLPVIVAESSRSGFFRVLVGPYHETAQIADAKARLKTLGFANAFVQKQ